MNRNVWSARLYKLATILVVVAMLFTGMTATALANDEPASDDGGGAQAAAANYSVGDGEREVAGYWQDYYDSSEGDLPNAQGNVTGFYNTLRYHNWTFWGLPRWCNFSGHGCYIWGNSAVWEDDFVDNNNSYIDSVDLVFYEGHGWPGGFTVRPPDDYYVEHWEVQNAWGNSDLEYLMLLSCSVLADSSKASWYGAFNGLHLMAGFANTAYDVGGFGSKLATDIVWGYSYKDAWFRACDTHQPSGVTARILAEENANYSESAYYSPYNFGVNPPHNGYYWWWDKACGAPTTSSLQPNQLGNEFPIFDTPPLSTAEADASFGNLTGAFDFGAEVGAASTYSMIGNTRVMTDAAGRTLEMENSTGQFYYFDPNKTFTPTVGLSAAQMLSPEDAKDIADQFLKDNGLMPADAEYNTTKPVVLTEEQVGGVNAARVFTETLTTYEVIYSRYLTTTVNTVDAASGEMRTEVVEIPVDGPGAKVKVYVSPAGGSVAAASAAQEDGAVVGAQGGWRIATESVNAAGVQETVTILPFDPVIKALFADNFLESHVAFTKVPFSNPTTKTILSQNLSTYEESTSASAGQKNLYPAYRLLARYEGVPANNPQAVSGLNETVVFTDYTWIPANETYMRPLAKIKSNSDVSKALKPGDTVTVEAWDATTKLKDAGFDPSLDFMMGTGGFTYQWYLNEVNDANKIGAANSKTLSFKVPATAEGSKNGLTTFKLIVLVTDLGNSNTALNNAQASLDVTAITPNYLPIIVRPQ